MDAPTRAHRLTLELQADTPEEMSNQLNHLAWRVMAGELTTGVSGGPSSGYIYELLSNPDQTHDRYFAEIRDYLAEIGKRSDGRAG